MKKLIAVAIICVFLSSCSAKNTAQITEKSGVSSDVSGSSLSENSAEPKQSFPILEPLDATNIWRIKPLDSTTVFVTAVKRVNRKTGEQDFILAQCDLQKKEVKSLYRSDSVNMDGIQNLRAIRIDDGSIAVFIGQGVFTITGEKVIYQLINPAGIARTSYHIQSEKYVYVDDNTQELRLIDMNTQQSKTLYQPEITREGERIRGTVPYAPVFSEDGQRVLFQLVTNVEATIYEKVECIDLDGNVLGQTMQIETRHADSLGTFWQGEDFFTLEATASSEDTQSGLATYVTIYNLDGTIKKGFNYECAISTLQNEAYLEHPLRAFSLDSWSTEDGLAKLGILNMDTGEGYTVYNSKGAILSPNITPDGTKVIWIEDGNLCELPLQQAERAPIPTFELP